MDYKFNEEVTDLLIQGGQLVKVIKESDKYESLFTGLIRLPKGKFRKDSRPEHPENYFEYVIIQTSSYSTVLGTVSVSCWGNDHLATMKKRTLRAHNDDMRYVYKRMDKKNMEEINNKKNIEQRTLILGNK